MLSLTSFTRRLKQPALATLAAVLAVSASALAGDGKKTVVAPESADWKPVWLTDLSLRVGESYDSNIYLAGVDVPAGPHVATRNKASWITTISPKIGIDLAKLIEGDSALKSFTLGYAPDFLFYHDASNESYILHRLTNKISVKTEDFTLGIDNAFSFINGDKNTLRYPGGSSAYANGTVRERRDQWQERTKAFVKVDLGPVFVRPVFALTYYDLDTNFYNGGAYSNYIDRYDINGGLDLGYNVSENIALTLGYRYGHQFQDTNPLTPAAANVTNDYQRLLVGIEGKPFSWLKLEAAVGPQFTTYNNNRPATLDRNNTDVYAEVAATFTLSKVDTLTFKYRRWEWVSSTGVNAYTDVSYDAAYKHKISKDLLLELGFRAGNSDYNPSSKRNDWDLTASAGFKYAVTENLTWDASYTFDKGRNDQSGVVSSTREFERNIYSTGLTYSF